MRVARSKPKEKLPERTSWSHEWIAEFWETHDSTDYPDQMEDAEVKREIPREIPQDYRVVSL